MPVVVWVALGGAIGASARHVVNVWSGRVFGTEFPVHTMTVNVLGCLLVGCLTGLFGLKLHASQEVRAFLVTGILGGFTTFSAFSIDIALLVQRKALMAAGLYALGTVTLSLLAVFAGLYLTRTLLP
jgi:CrcB protein